MQSHESVNLRSCIINYGASMWEGKLAPSITAITSITKAHSLRDAHCCLLQGANKTMAVNCCFLLFRTPFINIRRGIGKCANHANSKQSSLNSILLTFTGLLAYFCIGMEKTYLHNILTPYSLLKPDIPVFVCYTRSIWPQRNPCHIQSQFTIVNY